MTVHLTCFGKYSIESLTFEFKFLQNFFRSNSIIIQQIFTDVAVALAHAEMAKDIEGYLPAEHQFEARCAAYVLAKKYGVSTKAVEIDRVPEEYGVMDAAGIRENLARIHDSVKNISSGMYKALVKEKEQEVSPKEKSGKGGDAR